MWTKDDIPKSVGTTVEELNTHAEFYADGFVARAESSCERKR